MSIEGFWAKRAGFDAWAWDVLRAAAALSPPPPPESASPHADSTRHAGRRGARAAVSGFAVALALAAVLGLSAANPASAAANFVVDDTTDAVDATAADGRCRTAAGKCTLRAAIQQANALPGGDTIVIAEGVYALAIPPLNENLANNGDLDITGPLTIIGAGADDTILDGGEPAAGSPPLIRGLDRLLEIHPSAGDVSISGLTIREGYTAENGGGVYNASNGILSLVEVRLLDSYAAKYGGGVSNGGDGRLNLVHSTLSGNGAKEGGSAVNNAAGGYVAITDGSVVSDNPGTDPLVVPTPLDEYPIGGGAINNEGEGDTIGTIELADSVLSGNVAARDGAGIRNARDGVVIVAGSSIAGNSTSGGGGGIYSVSGTVSVSRDSTISDNHAGNDFSEGSGGAIHHVGRLTKAGVPGRLEIDDAIISANTATGDGGGVFSGLEAELALADATFAGNVAGDEGGGVSSQSKASTTISRVDFSSNVSGVAGGGVYADAEGDVTVTGSNFERNTAGETGGGGLYTDGKAGVAIADSTFERNTAVGDGGGVAIHSDGTITMTDSSVHGNASEEGGGGVENSGSLVTFDRVSVSENSAALDGGGIHNTSSGDFILLESSIRSNTAENGAGFANSPDGMLRISGSEFWDNSARQNGGGLLILGDADIEIVNSTLSGNSAAVSGGGFYTNADAHLLVVNATITANTAPVGSGIALSVESVNFPVVPATPVTLRNTIVADNLDGTDCHGGVFSEGGNLDGGTSCFLQDPSDRTNADPGLEPIALNGGLTRTHALVATSVAVDGGVDPCPETDQRGVTRPQNSRCDIGAYEFDGPATGGEPPPPSDEPDTTPPETTIYSTSPPGLGDATNESTVAEFAFTADEVAIFECALDGETFTNCESPEEYTGLTVGAHTFAVRAIDAAKNVDASPAEYSWTVVDLTAPETTIDSGPLDPTTETSASFQFSANEEGSTFQCAFDGAAFADCVSGIQYTGLAVGGHTFEVQAIDAAKNVEESPASHSWTIEAPPSTPDTTPPEVTIVEGPDDETSETSATFRFSVDEPARLECALDGTDIPDCVSPVELTELGLGPHTFVVEATDLVGNHGAASDSWTVVPAPDTSDPETTIDSGPDAVTRSIVAAITFSANEEVSSFKCSLGGASFSDCTSPYTLTDLEDGSYSFEVYAIDAAGNVDDTPAKHSWTVDTVEPETSIDSGPDASTTDTVAEFTFSADEPVSGFECSLDGAGFTSCVTGIEYTDLAVGLHSFEVRASDLAGNVGSASYAWRIEGPPPPTCDAGEVVVDAEADSWVLETSATTNFGNDSVLKIDSKAGGNARTLVRFTRAVIPPGCRLRSATLRLYAGSYKEGRKLHALQVAGQWDENTVTWSNKPQTTGPPAVADSGEGYREWTVTSQIMSMYAGFDNGFLIRDSAEGGVGIEQQFHSREKAPDSPPQLVITFD